MDYERAFHRERAARKKAEQLLEVKSRELYLANQDLSNNVSNLNAALLKNNFHMSISRYGIEKWKLCDFLPSITQEMLSIIKMPLGYFDYYPLTSKAESYRSEPIQNIKFDISEQDQSWLSTQPFDAIITHLSHQSKSDKQFHISEPPHAFTNPQADSSTIPPIHVVIGLPIFCLEHMVGVIYLLAPAVDKSQSPLLALFHQAMQQLGLIIEHRQQEDKLIQSYEEIKTANEALKKTQKQLLQSEKMASVGQLSAGIAHEINNPMGFIKSNISSLSKYIEGFDKYIRAAKTLTNLATQNTNEELANNVKQLDALWQSTDMEFLLTDCPTLLKESKQGIERVIDIIGGLKRFARQSDDDKEECHVPDTIEEALMLANNALKYSVKVNKQIDTVKPILGRSGELTQVFLNMLINAAQAIKENGEITIHVSEKNNGIAISVATLLGKVGECET